MEENNNGAATGGTEGTAQGTQNQAQSQQAEGNETNNATAGAAVEKTFTQAEVDALINSRLARERKKYNNPAQATEGATAPAAVEVDVTEDARKQANAIIAQANQRLIQAIAQAEANKLSINPDYIADAVRLADLSTVKVNDDGTVDTKSITAALEAVLTRMPVLKAAPESVSGGFKVGGQGNSSQSNGWSGETKKSGETKRWNKNRY